MRLRLTSSSPRATTQLRSRSRIRSEGLKQNMPQQQKSTNFVLLLGRSLFRRQHVFKKLLVLTLFFTPLISVAQVAPSNRGGGLSLSAGAEFSSFDPDWGTQRVEGITALFDLDHLFLNRLGVEGEARWLHFNNSQKISQNHYLLGPRYRDRKSTR